MKIKFNHEEIPVAAALGVEKKRMDEIMHSAHTEMIRLHPTGTKNEFLEQVLLQCFNKEELVAATLAWDISVRQMDTQRLMEKQKQVKLEQKWGVKPLEMKK